MRGVNLRSVAASILTDTPAPDANKKDHLLPPVVETADGLKIEVTEKDDGEIVINLGWDPDSPWQYLADISPEEAVEIVVNELVRLAQSGQGE